ncbi:hypothetical protein RvY_02368 [Ramazzottius varieornatus]|uniref:Uncharacterized protein n=1 Tax=Ramazzottius varieornatus TaxID=947166 RepID=A0A1D1UUL4_RAMVA|nr:hypothetical protein RvY_02368 [Ramazzottius varieornatus]
MDITTAASPSSTASTKTASVGNLVAEPPEQKDDYPGVGPLYDDSMYSEEEEPHSDTETRPGRVILRFELAPSRAREDIANFTTDDFMLDELARRKTVLQLLQRDQVHPPEYLFHLHNSQRAPGESVSRRT